MKNLKEILDAVGSTPTFLFEGVKDINQRSNFGDTPLHVVCHWGNLAAVKILVEAGAEINSIGEAGQSPLFSAVMSNSAELVEFLLESGADPSIIDNEGQNTLEFAKSILSKQNQETKIIINALKTAIKNH